MFRSGEAWFTMLAVVANTRHSTPQLRATSQLLQHDPAKTRKPDPGAIESSWTVQHMLDAAGGLLQPKQLHTLPPPRPASNARVPDRDSGQSAGGFAALTMLAYNVTNKNTALRDHHTLPPVHTVA